jgi:GxxExxY protein
MTVDMELNDITYKIRGAAFKVHTELGPGLFESVYKAALKYELEHEGLKVRTEVGVPMIYKDLKLEVGFRMDMLVEERVIIEAKSIDALAEVHFKQTLTYLRLAQKEVGLLINFNVLTLTDKVSMIRIINSHNLT